MKFVKIGSQAVNMEMVEVVGNLEGEGDVTLRMDSGARFTASGDSAKAIRAIFLKDEDAELMDDDFPCDCERCSDLKDALIDLLLEIEPHSKTVQ